MARIALEYRENQGSVKTKKLSCCCDSRSAKKLIRLLCDLCFNAIHCDRSVSTCEYTRKPS